MNLVILLILLLCTSAFTQAPDTLWIKTFGGNNYDVGYSVQQTIDGGYIITGHTNSFGVGGYDVWLIKTDAVGDTMWTRTFGGIYYDEGHSIQQTADSGYVITGSTRSYGAGGYDVWLIKTNAIGDTLWSKTFGDFSNDYGHSVQQTSDGGYIIIGESLSIGTGNNVFLIKTNPDGENLWTKSFGGVYHEQGFSVKQTNDGGYIIAGVSWLSSPIRDIWLIKTDADGDSMWTKEFGYSNTDDWSHSVQQTIDGGYIITGETTSDGAGGYDVWLIKTDAIGDTLWSKTFGGIGNDYGYSVQQTTDSGYIITGYTDSFGAGGYDVWLIRTDATGDTLWTKTFGGALPDFGHCVQQTTDGGYIVSGYTISYGEGGGDVWLIKVAAHPTAIDETAQFLINDYKLLQNYPNPFNPSTTISFSIPQNGMVTLKVFDLLGNEVKTLINEETESGYHQVEFLIESGTASGIYFYQLKTDTFLKTRKMLLLK